MGKKKIISIGLISTICFGGALSAALVPTVSFLNYKAENPDLFSSKSDDSDANEPSSSGLPEDLKGRYKAIKTMNEVFDYKSGDSFDTFLNTIVGIKEDGSEETIPDDEIQVEAEKGHIYLGEKKKVTFSLKDEPTLKIECSTTVHKNYMTVDNDEVICNGGKFVDQWQSEALDYYGQFSGDDSGMEINIYSTSDCVADFSMSGFVDYYEIVDRSKPIEEWQWYIPNVNVLDYASFTLNGENVENKIVDTTLSLKDYAIQVPLENKDSEHPEKGKKLGQYWVGNEKNESMYNLEQNALTTNSGILFKDITLKKGLNTFKYVNKNDSNKNVNVKDVGEDKVTWYYKNSQLNFYSASVSSEGIENAPKVVKLKEPESQLVNELTDKEDLYLPFVGELSDGTFREMLPEELNFEFSGLKNGKSKRLANDSVVAFLKDNPAIYCLSRYKSNLFIDANNKDYDLSVSGKYNPTECFYSYEKNTKLDGTKIVKIDNIPLYKDYPTWENNYWLGVRNYGYPFMSHEPGKETKYTFDLGEDIQIENPFIADVNVQIIGTANEDKKLNDLIEVSYMFGEDEISVEIPDSYVVPKRISPYWNSYVGSFTKFKLFDFVFSNERYKDFKVMIKAKTNENLIYDMKNENGDMRNQWVATNSLGIDFLSIEQK